MKVKFSLKRTLFLCLCTVMLVFALVIASTNIFNVANVYADEPQSETERVESIMTDIDFDSVSKISVSDYDELSTQINSAILSGEKILTIELAYDDYSRNTLPLIEITEDISVKFVCKHPTGGVYNPNDILIISFEEFAKISNNATVNLWFDCFSDNEDNFSIFTNKGYFVDVDNSTVNIKGLNVKLEENSESLINVFNGNVGIFDLESYSYANRFIVGQDSNISLVAADFRRVKRTTETVDENYPNDMPENIFINILESAGNSQEGVIKKLYLDKVQFNDIKGKSSDYASIYVEKDAKVQLELNNIIVNGSYFLNEFLHVNQGNLKTEINNLIFENIIKTGYDSEDYALIYCESDLFINGLTTNDFNDSYDYTLNKVENGVTAFANVGSIIIRSKQRTELTNVKIANYTSRMGGAFANAYSAIYATGETLLIKDSKFLFNESCIGGAVYAQNVEIIKSIFYGNKAINNASSSNLGGGAIYAKNNISISNNSLFKNNATQNKARGGAVYSGGIVSIDSVDFIENTSQNDGGAIYLTGTEIDIDNSSFIENTAGNNGGAIYANNNITQNTETGCPNIIIANSDFIENSSNAWRYYKNTNNASEIYEKLEENITNTAYSYSFNTVLNGYDLDYFVGASTNYDSGYVINFVDSGDVITNKYFVIKNATIANPFKDTSIVGSVVETSSIIMAQQYIDEISNLNGDEYYKEKVSGGYVSEHTQITQNYRLEKTKEALDLKLTSRRFVNGVRVNSVESGQPDPTYTRDEFLEFLNSHKTDLDNGIKVEYEFTTGVSGGTTTNTISSIDFDKNTDLSKDKWLEFYNNVNFEFINIDALYSYKVNIYDYNAVDAITEANKETNQVYSKDDSNNSFVNHGNKVNQSLLSFTPKLSSYDCYIIDENGSFVEFDITNSVTGAITKPLDIYILYDVSVVLKYVGKLGGVITADISSYAFIPLNDILLNNLISEQDKQDFADDLLRLDEVWAYGEMRKIVSWSESGKTETIEDIYQYCLESYFSDDTDFIANCLDIFKVEFEVDGTIDSGLTQEVVDGKKATEIEEANLPSKTGYTFSYWYVSGDVNKQAFSFDTVITEDITLVAEFTINKYTVEFEVDGAIDNTLTKTDVEHDTTVSKPADPNKTGYTFSRWYVSGDVSKAGFDFDTLITDDIILVAEFTINKYSVEFEIDGAIDNTLTKTNVEYDTTVSKPADPSKTGYTFSHWYVSGDVNKQAFSFDTLITDDITLVAEFTINKYTVEFEVDGAIDNSLTQEVDYNQKAIQKDAQKAGHTFVQWYYLDSQSQKVIFDFDTLIVENIVLIAEFTINKYKVEFNIDGQIVSDLTKLDIVYNTKINKPTTDPSKSGYTFLYWYVSTDASKTEFNFTTTPITGNTILVAAFKEITNTVDYYDNNGNKIGSVNVPPNSPLKKPEEPKAPDGYTFDGWYKDSNFTEKWDFDNDTVNSNITIYAVFIKADTTSYMVVIIVLAGVILVETIMLAILVKRKKNLGQNNANDNGSNSSNTTKSVVPFLGLGSMFIGAFYNNKNVSLPIVIAEAVVAVGLLVAIVVVLVKTKKQVSKVNNEIATTNTQYNQYNYYVNQNVLITDSTAREEETERIIKEIEESETEESKAEPTEDDVEKLKELYSVRPVIESIKVFDAMELSRLDILSYVNNTRKDKDSYPLEMEVRIRKYDYTPDSLRAGLRTYAMMYEKIKDETENETILKFKIRLPNDIVEQLVADERKISKTRFPRGEFWYDIDVETYSKEEIYMLLHQAYLFIMDKYYIKTEEGFIHVGAEDEDVIIAENRNENGED